MSAFFLYLFSMAGHGESHWTGRHRCIKRATAVTLAGIVLAQVANVFACRSDRHSVFRLPFLRNPLILWVSSLNCCCSQSLRIRHSAIMYLARAPLPVWIFGPLALGAVILLFYCSQKKDANIWLDCCEVARLVSSRLRQKTQDRHEEHRADSISQGIGLQSLRLAEISGMECFFEALRSCVSSQSVTDTSAP